MDTLTATLKFDITLCQSMDSDEVLDGQRLNEMAFLDEIGKCSDTQRTALMSLLNESTYVNYGVMVNSPLTSVIAATNEMAFLDEIGKCSDTQRTALMSVIAATNAIETLDD